MAMVTPSQQARIDNPAVRSRDTHPINAVKVLTGYVRIAPSHSLPVSRSSLIFSAEQRLIRCEIAPNL